jgi:hypothetical protein
MINEKDYYSVSFSTATQPCTLSRVKFSDLNLILLDDDREMTKLGGG